MAILALPTALRSPFPIALHHPDPAPVLNKLLTAPLLLSLLLTSACSGSDTDPGTTPLVVMAAASLNTVMPELVASWAQNGGGSVDVVLASTGNLAAQIENGAPGDLFLAADRQTPERLADAGEIDPRSLHVYALGQVTLIWRDGVTPPQSIEALTLPDYEVVATANPEFAPYGAAAVDALRGAGIWDEVEPKVVYGENIGQAYQFVRTGNADVGLVAKSSLSGPDEPNLPIPDSLYSAIEHAGGILAASSHPDAEAFLDYILSAAGQEILARHGFGSAPAP